MQTSTYGQAGNTASLAAAVRFYNMRFSIGLSVHDMTGANDCLHGRMSREHKTPPRLAYHQKTETFDVEWAYIGFLARRTISVRLTLSGRVLFLCDDPLLVDAQLGGRDLTLAEAGRLRDDVSTDEISPVRSMVYFDDRLGQFPYTAFTVGGRMPIGVDLVSQCHFCVTVAGHRYGKGSSREHSPVAEKFAGIRLVVARSFERIYRQNADNQGLFTSTDFGLIERIQHGESIEVEELIAARDSLTAEILRAGGLLRYGQGRFRHGASEIRTAPVETALTLAEKIIHRHLAMIEDRPSKIKAGEGTFVRPDWRFIHEYYTAMAAHLLYATHGHPLQLHDPGSILAFEDHLSFVNKSPMHLRDGLVHAVQALGREQRNFAREYGLTNHGHLDFTTGEEAEGISHPMMTERCALPGQLVVGTDSHTPHSGAIGCLAFGIGTTDMANAFVTGAVRVTVPESIRVELRNPIPVGVTAKDIALFLLADHNLRAGAGLGRVFEFTGSAVAALSCDERVTLTNMTAELGGFSGIVAPDAETIRFLKERRGIEFVIQPWMTSDSAARYAQVIEIDCAGISPMVASPGDPGNGFPLSRLDTRPQIDIAYGGSCTGGKRQDFDHYHSVLAWALNRGLTVPPHVELILQFGTVATRDYCEEKGYLETFRRVGAIVLQPSCGACANCGPGSSIHSEQITVSAINRNFPGRSGLGKLWLASPPTVAASAIAGELVSFTDLIARHS